MDINSIKAVYFIGAGGIGMSALVRYFLSKGKKVAGYDKTPSELTHKLQEEGADIHYEENVSLIPEDFRDASSTLVVYTPAIPAEHKELCYFQDNKFEIHKRAQVLGMLTRTEKGICGSTAAVVGMPLIRQLLFPSAVISRLRSSSAERS